MPLVTLVNKMKNKEIEQVKQEIKVLQSKLALLEEMEKYKSPAEEAYKEWMGKYPPTDESVDNTDDIRWRAFQMGWMKAQQTYEVGEYQPTPQTPEQVEEGLKQAFREAKESEGWQDTQKKIEGFISIEELDCIRLRLGKTLEDVIREWTTIFNIRGDMDRTTMIQDLCNKIYGWLPAEQSSKGTQRIETEIAVDSHNELLNKIKSKIYSNEGHSN